MGMHWAATGWSLRTDGEGNLLPELPPRAWFMSAVFSQTVDESTARPAG
jgi:hypothetical protein